MTDTGKPKAKKALRCSDEMVEEAVMSFMENTAHRVGWTSSELLHNAEGAVAPTLAYLPRPRFDASKYRPRWVNVEFWRVPRAFAE